MPLHKMINGFIPTRPIYPHATNIPPIAVKLSIPKSHNFSERIEERLEKGEETSKPAEEGDGAEFHDAFGDIYEIEGGDVVEAILEEGDGVLSAGDPDYD
jgi:hypothetical protein